MPASFHLVVKAGPDEGKQIELEKTVQIIGRDQGADIPISDPEVSRKHTRISNQGGQYIIEDLGSTNGTFVNNQRISAPYVLKPGELIFLGEHVTLLFEAVQTGEETVVAPSRIAATPPPLQEPAPQPQKPEAAPYQALRPSVPQPVQNLSVENYPPPVSEPYAGAAGGQQISAAKKKLPRWAIILIVVAILLFVFCVLPLIIVDSMNLWCSGFLGNIMRAIGPGSCP